jgi:hypothetical protein
MNSFVSLSSQVRSVKLLVVFAAFVLGLCSVRPAEATMDQYRMTESSGDRIDMSGANVIFDGSWAGSRTITGYGFYDLGFNFNLDGTEYNTFAIYTSGIITLGNDFNNQWYDSYLSQSNVATIAPFMNYMGLTGNAGGCWQPSASFITLGSAPNRVFVVEWNDWELEWFARNRGSFQARLYESASGVPGKIEFWYGNMMAQVTCFQGSDVTSWDWYGYSTANIGVASGAGDYFSVRYSGPTPELEYNGSPQEIDVNSTSKPGENTLLTFDQLPDVQLSSTPKVLNFGLLSAGATADLCVTVRNAGSEGELTFMTPILTGSPAYTVISAPTDPLTPGQTATYCLRFAPTADGVQNGVFTIVSNGRDSGTQQILLTGDATAPEIEIAPIGENFATRMFRKARVRLGDTVEQGIIVKNKARGELIISPNSFISGDNPQFYWISRLPDAQLLQGVSDTLFVKFSPRVEGLLLAKLNILSNAQNGTKVVDLAGVGVIARIVVTPDPLKFDSVQIGKSDTAKFTICNPGSDTLKLIRNYLSSADGDFTVVPITGNDLVIAPDKCREVTVIFTPQQMGTRVARLAIQTNIPLTFETPRRDTATNTLYYDITGTGVPIGTLISADIRTNGIKDSSLIGVEKCQNAVITNIGDADVTINSTTFNGAAAADYKLTGITLPYVLKAKSSVTVQICGTPTLRGSNLVSLTIAGTSNEMISSLTGTVDIKGLLACVTPSPTVAFQDVKVPHGVTDSADVTITNCGDVATAYNVTISGADAPLYVVNPLTSPVVAPGGTTTFRVYFTPTTSGVKTGMLTFTGTAVMTTVDLAGVGACAVLEPISVVQAPATAAGSTQQFTISVTNSGNLDWTPGTPVITPATAFTFVSGGPILAGQSGDLTFSFNPPSMNEFTAVVTFPNAEVCGNPLEINVAGSATAGSVKDVRTADGYILSQNSPNPAIGGTTSFNYTVPANAKVRIVLADVTGKITRELVNTNVAAGTYGVTVETTELASGTYMYIMEAGNARLVRQLSVTK